MAKKSFRKDAEASLGGLSSIIQNTTRPPLAKREPSSREKAEEEALVKKEVVKAPVRKKPVPKAERPRSEAGCKEGDTRKTFIIKKELAEQMQDIAYWEPGKLKDHVNAALEAYVKKKWNKKRPKGS
jgi:hypothetical protein